MANWALNGTQYSIWRMNESNLITIMKDELPIELLNGPKYVNIWSVKDDEGLLEKLFWCMVSPAL